MSDKKRRVILIGVDGATWSLIDKFIEQGSLPAFSQLKKEGSWGILKSTVPCYSPLAWNSIFTGTNPAKHGIFGFVEHLYGSLNLRPLSSADRMYPTLWNYANYFNIDSIFINLPFSFPLETVRGIFISGLGTPSQDCNYTFPLDFKNYIKKNYPDYRIDFDEELMSNKNDREYFYRESFKIFRSRLELAKELFTQENWKNFSLVIRLTDILQHFCWDDVQIIRKAYMEIDNFLVFLFSKMDSGDTLFLISDHGFSSLKQMVHIVNFFLQEGYMVFKKKAKVKKGITTEQIKKYTLKIGGKNLLNFLKRNALLKNILFRTLPVGKYSYLRAIDWENSLISYAEGSGGIAYFNPKIKSDTEKMKNLFLRLRINALKLKHDGEEVFEDIYRGKQLYNIDSPDVIFRVKKGYCVDGFDFEDKSMFGKSKSGYIGMHDEDGLIAIYGSGVKKGLQIMSANVYDILPTLLALLNKEIPSYFDGKMLQEAFTSPLEYRRIDINKETFFKGSKFYKGYSEEEKVVIEERLRSLGYL